MVLKWLGLGLGLGLGWFKLHCSARASTTTAAAAAACSRRRLGHDSRDSEAAIMISAVRRGDGGTPAEGTSESSLSSLIRLGTKKGCWGPLPDLGASEPQ